ncbi:hypothetical protein ACHAP5_012323 [Fusarium lateritium]
MKTVVGVMKALSLSAVPYLSDNPPAAYHWGKAETSLRVWLRQSSRATGPSFCVSTEDFRNYLNTIFENWPSESADPGGPSPLDCTVDEARIEVGTLRVDAPLSKMQARKANPAQKPTRLAGQPVFCGITLDYETDGIAFTWKDRYGAGISYDIVLIPTRPR